jgi:hypothetical protein
VDRGAGPRVGRPHSATRRTRNAVGLPVPTGGCSSLAEGPPSSVQSYHLDDALYPRDFGLVLACPPPASLPQAFLTALLMPPQNAIRPQSLTKLKADSNYPGSRVRKKPSSCPCNRTDDLHRCYFRAPRASTDAHNPTRVPGSGAPRTPTTGPDAQGDSRPTRCPLPGHARRWPGQEQGRPCQVAWLIPGVGDEGAGQQRH